MTLLVAIFIITFKAAVLEKWNYLILQVSFLMRYSNPLTCDGIWKSRVYRCIQIIETRISTCLGRMEGIERLHVSIGSYCGCCVANSIFIKIRRYSTSLHLKGIKYCISFLSISFKHSSLRNGRAKIFIRWSIVFDRIEHRSFNICILYKLLVKKESQPEKHIILLSSVLLS